MEQHIVFLILIVISIVQFLYKRQKKKAEQAEADARKRKMAQANEGEVQPQSSNPFEEFIKNLKEEPAIEEYNNIEEPTEKETYFSYENEDVPTYKDGYQELKSSLFSADAESDVVAEIEEIKDFDLRKAMIYNAILERRY